MEKIKDKSKRLVKYWYVRYKQSSQKDRTFLGMYVLTVLAFIWWAMLLF